MSAQKKAKASLPESLVNLIAEAERARGLPAGTLRSIVQQETGGDGKYISDPTAYHYGLNAEGKRVAGHTGKISTAFGPFGILESTGRKPGYGVEPLRNKSIEEQVRFAGDYLAARAKSAGSLEAGLAGYGEGEKYASQVIARRDGRAQVQAQVPTQAVTVDQVAAAADTAAPIGEGGFALPAELIAALTPKLSQAGSTPSANANANAWQAFLQSMPQNRQPVRVADIDYDSPRTGMRVPQFQFNPAEQPQARAQSINFMPFSSFGRYGRA